MISKNKGKLIFQGMQEYRVGKERQQKKLFISKYKNSNNRRDQTDFLFEVR